MYPVQHSETSMSEQAGSHYIRTHDYIAGSEKTRLPGPAPSFYDDDSLSLREVIRPSSHDFQEGEFVPSEFFQIVNPENFVYQARLSDWDYTWRRQAQEILPFLYLGPVSCLKDKAWLASEKFSLLLAIRNTRSAQARLVSGEKVGAEMAIEADSVNVMDNQELISAFPHIIKRINEHLISSGAAGDIGASPDKKILVFCETGNERSATVVIAYIMVMLNLNVSHALHLVQQRRFCICIEEPLRQLLASFQYILEAKQDVQRAQRAMSGSSLAVPQMTVSRKRSAYRLDNEARIVGDDGVGMGVDINMDISSDTFGDRRPLAPFRDR